MSFKYLTQIEIELLFYTHPVNKQPLTLIGNIDEKRYLVFGYDFSYHEEYFKYIICEIDWKICQKLIDGEISWRSVFLSAEYISIIETNKRLEIFNEKKFKTEDFPRHFMPMIHFGHSDSYIYDLRSVN